MFSNLKAEMARKSVSSKALSQCLGVSEKTVNNKLSGRTEFTLSEILKINSAIFPEYKLEYLFSSGDSAMRRESRADK